MLETPGLLLHRDPGPCDKFLRVSEGEMLWDTPPHSNNPTREGLPRRRSCMMPEQHMGRSHLTSILIDTYASISSLSTPSNLTPPLSSFSTPTLLHTHNSLSSTCNNTQPGCADKPMPHYSLLLASPEKEASFRPLLLGYKPSRGPDLSASSPEELYTWWHCPAQVSISGGLHGFAKLAPAAQRYFVIRMLHSSKRSC